MKNDRRRLAGGASLALALAAYQSQAATDCDAARAVALEIVPGAAASAADALEQALIAELEASHIAVCGAPPRALQLPRVQIRATQPDWQRASIRWESARAPAIERELDVSKLPPEARPLAIASATDELIRSALDGSAASATATPTPAPGDPPGAGSALASPPPGDADGATAAASTEAAALAAPAPAREAFDSEARGVGVTPRAAVIPRFELGLALGGSSYRGQREALEEELLARYWLSPSLPLTLRAGLAQRLSRPEGRGRVQPGADVHAALGTGLALFGESGGFELFGDAGVQLSRVAFDERVALEDQLDEGGTPALTDDVIAPIEPNALDTPRRPESVSAVPTHALDHGWGLAASLGVEGRGQLGSMGFSVALAALLPLVAARSDWGDQTSLDALGVQLRAGIWIVLDSAAAPIIERAGATLAPGG